MFSIKYVILIAIVAFAWYKRPEPPKPLAAIVKTELGELQGIKSLSRNGREYSEYLGIPYAKPPVGPLRFEAPEEPEKWTGVRPAINYGNECIQMQLLLANQVGEEDCLFLNVFTPKRSEHSNELLPTMVWIHGGHYLEGSGNMYRPDYFMDEGSVVLVTINYRLAALGFLSTGDDGVVAGNAGLKDQSMALAFVQRNIAQFGGDPKQITLFGESAGGASVHFHMISPKSQGLFQKAISQSGTALAPWTIQTTPREQAERFARRLDCPTSNTDEMVQCLKEVAVEKIIATHADCRDALKDPLSTYLPTVEVVKNSRAFLSEHPLTLVKKMKSSVPYLTGINKDEGLIFQSTIARNQSLQAHLANPDKWLKAMPIMLWSSNLKLEDLQQLRQYYFDGKLSIDFEKYFDNYTTLFSDVTFNYGFMETVKYHSQHSPVYAYHFAYPGEFSIYNLLLEIKGHYPPLVELLTYTTKRWIYKNVFGTSLPHYGVSHADELAYLFKLEMMNDITPLDKDYEMSKKMVKLWISFATNEKSMEYNGLVWKPFNPKDTNFEVFNIGEKGGYIANPFGERMEFLKKHVFKR